MLADIANSLRLIVWSKTKDGEKNRNRPKPIKPPKKPKEKTVTYTVDDYKERLSRPRREV